MSWILGKRFSTITLHILKTSNIALFLYILTYFRLPCSLHYTVECRQEAMLLLNAE